jgi:hypothetical protein
MTGPRARILAPLGIARARCFSAFPRASLIGTESAVDVIADSGEHWH